MKRSIKSIIKNSKSILSQSQMKSLKGGEWFSFEG